jgi:hypothetical protein
METQEEIQALQKLLKSKGWKTLVEYINFERERDTNLLIAGNLDKVDSTDEFVRGGLQMINKILTYPEERIQTLDSMLQGGEVVRESDTEA